MERKGKSSIDIHAQLACCAECIERRPLDEVAWCLLCQVLCDKDGVNADVVRNSVLTIWASPRCKLWARLFYASPLPACLHGAPNRVFQGLVLLFVHFPNGHDKNLQHLLRRFVESRQKSQPKSVTIPCLPTTDGASRDK